MPTELPLTPGVLPAPFICYQPLYNEMFALGAAQGPAITGLLIQDATPDAGDHDKGWIPTAGGVPRFPGYVFVWNTVYGHWVSRHAIDASDIKRYPAPYVGTLADFNTFLQTYDGGDAGAPGVASGPMWEVDPQFAGSVPIGVGAIPGSSPAASIVQGGATSDSLGASGEYKHSLTPDEIQHMHGVGQNPLDVSPDTEDDPAIQLHRTWDSGANNYVSSHNDMVAPGSTGYIDGANVHTGAFGTSKALADPDFPVVNGHNTMQPYVGVFFLKRTARQFYVAA